MRNIFSALRILGSIKRTEPVGTDEEFILVRTLRDMNMSRLVAKDLIIFLALLRDIFPKQTSIPEKVNEEIEIPAKKLLKEKNLCEVKDWYIKIIQLYEISMVRHGIILLGSEGSGKSTILNTLMDVLNEKIVTKAYKFNPKSFTNDELYGEIDSSSGEWINGVLSQIYKKCNETSNKHVSWIISDGPIDAIWIESLNTVLDDNKKLCLDNGEIIPMNNTTRIVFEAQDLKVASPATVSRCGIVYVSSTDLFWKPLIEIWCKDRVESRGTINGCCSPDEYSWMLEF